MMYKVKVAVHSEIRMKHSNARRGPVEFLNVKPVVHKDIRTLGFKRLRPSSSKGVSFAQNTRKRHMSITNISGVYRKWIYLF
jgi:hypothetical protein